MIIGDFGFCSLSVLYLVRYYNWSIFSIGSNQTNEDTLCQNFHTYVWILKYEPCNP